MKLQIFPRFLSRDLTVFYLFLFFSLFISIFPSLSLSLPLFHSPFLSFSLSPSLFLSFSRGGRGVSEPCDSKTSEKYSLHNNTALIDQISLFDTPFSHDKYLKFLFKIKKNNYQYVGQNRDLAKSSPSSIQEVFYPNMLRVKSFLEEGETKFY